MSSSSIMSAIRKKEKEIQTCQAEIRRLEKLLENQQAAHQKFNIEAEKFEALIDGKRVKVENVTVHAPKSALADKFGAHMDTVFNSVTWGEQKEKMAKILDNMEIEICETESDLENEQQLLIHLENELSN